MSVKQKLTDLIRRLDAKAELEWNSAIEKYGKDYIVPLDRWSLSSRIQFWVKGSQGTTETRNNITGPYIIEPSPPTNRLLLIFIEGLKEFECEDLTDDIELMEFFEYLNKGNVSLRSIDDIDKLF